MLGAIAGDIIGSVYEWHNIKTTDFPLFSENCRFTDDSVLTCALADSILNGAPYNKKLREYYNYYPGAGYGGNFKRWASGNKPGPYNSCGNGSAMRVSPVGFTYDNIEKVLDEAKKSAEVTHNHPEGIKGAQATAAAIFMARTGESKEKIRELIEKKFFYNLSFTLDEIRPSYSFQVLCQDSVPEAIRAFLESNNFEQAIRLAISIGGDSDTIACITGGIAEAFYGEVPLHITGKVLEILDERLSGLVVKFYKQIMNKELKNRQNGF